MKKVMIVGAGGQLGRELCSIYPEAFMVYHNSTHGQASADLQNPQQIEDIIVRESPDLVINAAALANVDLCEKDHELAYAVNSQAVNSISKACRRSGARFVHVSTDYVFDGSRGNYTESSAPNPINYYGLSKLVGDAFALSYEESVVVRTSGVFGYQKNFPIFVLETLRAGRPVNAFQGFYSPIHARNLAKAISLLVMTDFKGLINISGPRVSRYELAVRIAEEFGLDSGLVKEAADVKTLNAKRPFDSSLDNALAMKSIDFDFYSAESNLKAFKSVLAQ